jgi:hypothetical protein
LELAINLIQIFVQLLSELDPLICVSSCDLQILKIDELHFLKHRGNCSLRCFQLRIEGLGICYTIIFHLIT